jgi:hypothetical protein
VPQYGVGKACCSKDAKAEQQAALFSSHYPLRLKVQPNVTLAQAL